MQPKFKGLFASKYFRTMLGLAVSGLALFLALRNVDFHQVWRAISQASPWYVALALISVGVNTLAKIVRWRDLLGATRHQVSFYNLATSFLSGQMLNLVYPVRVGDLSRAYIIGGMGPGRVFTLGTILLEKLLDTLAYTLLFFLLILLIPLPGWVNNSVVSFTIVIVIAALVVLLLAYHPARFLDLVKKALDRFPGRFQSYLLGRFHSGLSSLEVLHARPVLLKLLFWSAIIWATAILNNQLILLALGIHLPWTASLLILMVLQAGISLPSIPARVGIFEYSCILALSIYGISQSNGLSYGILLHMIVFLPVLIPGLLAFWLLGLGRQDVKLLANLPEQGAASANPK